MRKYFLTFFIFIGLFVSAQQISFQHNYAKGDNVYITTFTELKSLEIVIGYTLIQLDTSLLGPHTLELHLMKVDKNGVEIWDRLIKKDTTRFAVDRFCIQNIDEQNDGSLIFDITFPYGDKNIAKYDANGNQKWETNLHVSFGDNNINTQLIKHRGRNIALSDGSVISVGTSFKSILPQATLSFVDANGTNPYDRFFYTGYFNDAYYLNFDHLYTVGVELNGALETLVFSDLKTDGGVHYQLKTAHKANEKILATSLVYTSTKIRIAESLSKKDSTFYVNIYDYDHGGKLLAVSSYKLNCAATCINLKSTEIDWVLSNQCKSDASQTIEKMESNNHLAFSFSDTFDNVLVLKKLHDENYLFSFSKGPGINLWKINSQGTLQTGKAAEGLFAPNPAKNYVNLIGNIDTYNHSLSVKLFDMLGNTLRVYSFDKSDPVHIDLSGLREGIYIYTLITDAGVQIKGKLVVNQKN